MARYVRAKPASSGGNQKPTYQKGGIASRSPNYKAPPLIRWRLLALRHTVVAMRVSQIRGINLQSTLRIEQ